jgi:hypothetical protein
MQLVVEPIVMCILLVETVLANSCESPLPSVRLEHRVCSVVRCPTSSNEFLFWWYSLISNSRVLDLVATDTLLVGPSVGYLDRLSVSWMGLASTYVICSHAQHQQHQQLSFPHISRPTTSATHYSGIMRELVWHRALIAPRARSMLHRNLKCTMHAVDSD